MLKFSIFLCILIVSPRWCHCEIPFDKVKFDVFDTNSTNFEMNVYNSLQSTQSFFADEDVKTAIDVGATVLSLLPFIGKMYEVVKTASGLLGDQSDWKNEFAQAIAGETMRSIAENQIFWMQAQIQTIQKNIPLLDKAKQPSEQNRISNAQYIHNTLDTMINYLDHKTGVFRKFPLLSAPLVISISCVVATFIPIAHTIIPIEMNQFKLAYKTRGVLKAFRARTFMARANKFNTIYEHYAVMMEVLAKPYHLRGYNEPDQNVLHCNIGCDMPASRHNAECLLDDFAIMKYNYGLFVAPRIRNRCIKEYTGLVRHRVEQMFPVDIFDQLSGPTSHPGRAPTGKIQNLLFQFTTLQKDKYNKLQ